MINNPKIPDGYYMISHKYRIYPTTEQSYYLDRCIDLNRFAYNWAVEQIEAQEVAYYAEFAEKMRPSEIDLETDFRSFRNNNEFIREAPYATIKLGIWNAVRNFSNYDRNIFKNIKRPKFKSKKRQKFASFLTRNNRAYFIDSYLVIEGLNVRERGMIKTGFNSGYKSISENPKYFKVCIIKDTVRNIYWVSFTVLENKKSNYFQNNNIPEIDRAIGIDLNKNKRYVLSNGKIYYQPDKSKAKKRLKRIRRHVQRDIDRRRNLERINPAIQITQSKREIKRMTKMRKAYAHIANIETNFNQQVTSEIIKMHPKAVVMEDLRLSSGGMLSKKFTDGHLKGVQFRAARDMMEYKCKMYKIPFILAPPEYPSTQLCSNCGARKQMNSSNKVYKCPVCGMRKDRDINAAINLERLAYA